MPCQDAMVDRKIVVAHPETTLEEVIELFDKYDIRSVPVIDADDKLVGLFNFHRLLLSILPISADLSESHDLKRYKKMDISLDHVAGQSGWVAGRLKNILSSPMSELMVKDPKRVHPDTPLREGIHLMARYGSPLSVTDEETNKLVGLISSQSALKVLLAMKTDLKRGRAVEDFEE